MYSYGKGSIRRMEGLVTELRSVLELAIKLTDQDYSVVCGLRTIDEQRKIVASGFSKSLDSRHLTGHAVDLVPYVPGVNPWPVKGDSQSVIKEKLRRFENVARAMFLAADELDIPLQWGNDWDCDGIPTSHDPDEKALIVDMPHFQIPHAHRLDVARARANARRAARANGVYVVS